MQTLLVIYHGLKFNEKKLKAWRDVVSVRFQARLESTKYKNHGTDLARTASESIILVLGGDGLIHEVVNGIVSNKNKPTLVFHSCGTGNDYQRVLPGCSSPQHFLELVENGKYVSPDILKVEDDSNFAYCNNTLDIGFGGKVVEVLEENRAKRKRLPYTRAILKSFSLYKAQDLLAIINGEKHKFRPLLIAVSKGKYFGSGIGICPQADLFDGKMALTIIDQVSVRTYLKYLPKLKKAQEIKDERVSYRTVQKLEIHRTSQELELDGELYKFNKTINISVVTNAIKVLTSS